MTSLLTCFILSQWTLYCTENQMKYIYCTEDEIKEAHRGFPDGFNGKESACQCRRCRFDPCVGKIPWRRKWQPTSVFLLGNPMSLVGYSPWGLKNVRHNLVTKQQQQKSIHWQLQSVSLIDFVQLVRVDCHGEDWCELNLSWNPDLLHCK